MTNIDDLTIGQYVKSIAGRDNGNIFIVKEIIDDKFVKIIDGDLRKVESPKKKNIKHLQKIDKVSRLIKETIEGNKKVSNLMVKQEITKLGVKEPK
jgi:ribosomal protein L14E/L6E/L27E